MKQSEYILSNDVDCKYCYKCLRSCPVKAICFHNDKSYVIEDECILCGTCTNVCPQNAKVYRSDILEFENLLGKPFAVSIAPSLYGNFDSPSKVFSVLKELGAVYISETAVGAEFITDEYLRIYKEVDKPFITTSCPVVVNLVEKHYPQFLHYLLPVVSPAVAHAKFLNCILGDIHKIFIGPCIAKKEELREYFDVVLTFEELDEFFRRHQINVTSYKDHTPDPPYPDSSRMYPISGGILFSAKMSSYAHFVLEGVENIIDFFKTFDAMIDSISGVNNKIIIEASACYGGCLNGPASIKKNLLEKKFALVNTVKHITNSTDENKKLKIRNYNFSLRRHFANKKQFYSITEEQIKEILKSMGKNQPDKELNCRGCGYETCQDKAKAVYLGKAEKEMCFAYLIEKVSSVSNKVVDESPNGIIIFDAEKVKYMNPSAKKLFGQYTDDRALDICYRIFNEPDRIHELYIGGSKYYFYPKVFQLPEDSGNVVLLVDVTEMVLQREKLNELKKRTIEKIDEVLNNQMKLAQDIASLLGESIAETKAHFLEFKKYMGEDYDDM
ncbi:MAG: [Fe-Fe] hydrogenase large subunit C-terminal domain-containing protein [Fervidobacterium sp.]